MKLKNFIENQDFNKLRKSMGANLIEWRGTSAWSEFNPIDFRKKLETEGEIELTLSKIEFSADGSLQVFGKKVIVYIRDQIQKYRTGSGYKFHVANCRTLQDARNNQRDDRYVVSIKTDGIFDVITKNSGKITTSSEKLSVCRNCLFTLNYEKYRFESKFKRDRIFQIFSLHEYFSQYKNSTIITPKYTSATAPYNDYPKNFNDISNALKIKRNYKCELCLKDFTQHHQFLHCHHRNGIKSQNTEDNLLVLCIGCHSEQLDHAHMKHHPNYLKFIAVFGHVNTNRSPIYGPQKWES